MPSLTGVSQVVCTQAGKNVIDISGTDPDNGYISGRWISSSNSPNTNADWYTTEYLPILPNTEYTISGIAYGNSPAFCFYDETKTFISGIAYSNRSTITFTTPNNAKYARFSIRNDFTAFMLEFGTTATTYEPYTDPIVTTVPLGRTIYGGSVDVVMGTGTEKWKKVTISDFTWTIDANGRFKSNNVTDRPVVAVRTWHFLCDNYQVIEDGRPLADVPDRSIYGGGSSGDRSWYVHDSRYSTVEDFLTAMGDTIIVYPLATAYYTDFTFDPITPMPQTPESHSANFWADTGDSTVGYRRDIDLALQAVSGTRNLLMTSIRPEVSHDNDPEQLERTENPTEEEGDTNNER